MPLVNAGNPINRCRTLAFLTSWLIFWASCGPPIRESLPAFFFIDEVPGTGERFRRADLPSLREDGHQSAAITLGDETRRALTPFLPSKLTFAAQIPPKAVLHFAIAVATLGKPRQWTPVEFRVAVNTGSGEQTCFKEIVGLPQRNHWLDRTVDLADWSGKNVQITFEVISGAAGSSTPPNTSSFPLWGNPVLFSTQSRSARPPLILISIDCLRADHMGLYGYRRETTPRIDEFARDSAVFAAAYSASSWTLPSHMSMLTGLTPSFHAASRTQKPAPSVPYLPAILSEAGYEVIGVVSGAYLSPDFGFERGFHIYRVLHRPRASETVDEAIELLKRAQGRELFLFLHLIDPHWRYLPPGDFIERFGPAPPDLDKLLNKVIRREPPSSQEEVEQLKTLYDGEIAYVDQEIGRLFDWLKAMGLYESALIVVTSDHGEAFYEHAYWQHSDTLYEEMTRIPLIVKRPRSSAGARVETPVSQIEIFHTILEEARLPQPTRGMSLNRYLQDAKAAYDGRIISETAWWSPDRTRMKVAFRHKDMKYIATFAGRADDPLSIDAMLQEELYDLATDPQEKDNLETSRHMKDFRRELRAHLEEARKFRAERHKGGAVVMDELVKERLRSLGYIQ